jgi:hypothetical protein
MRNLIFKIEVTLDRDRSKAPALQLRIEFVLSLSYSTLPHLPVL